jgi:hypothetical protein
VRPGKEAEFETLYGSEGRWASFFRHSPAYQGTLLLRDPKSSGDYVVLDVWDHPSARESYCHEHAAEYQRLDAAGAALTASERHVGWFDDVQAVLATL